MIHCLIYVFEIWRQNQGAISANEVSTKKVVPISMIVDAEVGEFRFHEIE